MLSNHRIETELGPLAVMQSEQGICSIALHVGQADARFQKWRRKFAPEEALGERELLPAFQEQIDAYLAGDLLAFDVPMDLRGSDFQQRVWQRLLAIPRGSVRTYGEVARELGSPRASQAVGGANGANPIPILVPCHRVVARKGLGGFSGPMRWKQGLLELEGVCLRMPSDSE